MPTIAELGQRVKTKYPGTYDSLSDEDVGRRVKAKYPGSYNDFTESISLPVTVEQPSAISRAATFVARDVAGAQPKSEGLLGSLFQSTVGSRGFAGVAQMPGKVIGQVGALKDQTALSESLGGLADQTRKLIAAVKETPQSPIREQLVKRIRSNMETLDFGREERKIIEDMILSPRETISTSANAALTALTGSGSLAKTAAVKATERFAPKALPAIQKLVTSGKGLIPRAAEQAGISAGFTASQNIAEGRPIAEGTLGAGALGAAIPIAGSGIAAARRAIPKGENLAERIINSLVKPLLKDFSYGKNPGRGVAREGIVADSFDALETKIDERVNALTEQLNGILTRAGDKRISLRDILKPLQEARAAAAKNPRTNAALIQRIDDTMADLAENLPANVDFVAPEMATTIKRLIGSLTKFTGNPSDDRAINAALKRIYGSIKERINTAVPEAADLNERLADLISASVATKYRDKILGRQNIISLGGKVFGIGSAIIASIATGGATLPAILAGAGGIALDKALSTPSVKTRIAAWLAKSSPAEREAIFKNVPALRNAIERVFGYVEGKKPP